MYFDPITLSYYGNTVIGTSTYFQVSSPPAGSYAFKAQAWSGNALIKIYNSDLILIGQAYNELIINLSDSKYYLFIEANVDTLISVVSSAILSSSASIIYREGVKANITLAANTAVIYSYAYTKTESQTRFYLNINEVLGENLVISLYYLDSLNNLVAVNLIKTGITGRYFCDLSKDNAVYYISVNSSIAKVLQIDLYVPASIASIEIENSNIYNYINSLKLGIGESYTFNVGCSVGATYGAKVRIVNPKAGIALFGSKLTIDYNKALIGYILELSFETIDGNDYKMFQFVISLPYTVNPYVIDNKFYLDFYDVFGNLIQDPSNYYSTISYFYSYNSQPQSLGALTQTYVDLTYLPTAGDVLVYANIYDKQNNLDYKDVSCIFAEQYYSIYQTTQATGQTRLSFNDNTVLNISSKTIDISANVLNVTFKSTALVAFTGISINILERSLPLTINFDNFVFKTSTNRAINYSGTQVITINVYGICSAETTQAGSSAIYCPNLIISGGGTFTVTGANQTESSSARSAGAGIVATNLSIIQCALNVYGGNGTLGSGYNGYRGANGGNAVECANLNISNSTVKLYGGAGGNGIVGANGADRTASDKPAKATGRSEDGKIGLDGGSGSSGGAGGSGGFALNITNMPALIGTNRIELYGGRAGNGGDGGVGGKGGEGGDGNDAYAIFWPFDVARAGRGGTGGTGGVGGNGGAFGVPGQHSNLDFICNVKIEGSYGFGGKGGNGGAGGKGGKGGDNDFWNCGSNYGGFGGTGGTGGNGYFNTGGSGGAGGLKGTDGDGQKAGGITNTSNGSIGSSGKSFYGYIYNGSGQKTQYKVSFSTTRTLTLLTSSNTGDPYLEIFDENGNLLAYNDDGGGNFNAKLTYTFSANKNYIIVARSFSATASSSYYLSVT